LKGVRSSDPGCLSSYRDTPQETRGEDHEGASKFDASSVFDTPLRQTSTPTCVNREGLGSRLGRRPSTCLSTARALLPRCIRPTTATHSTITSTHASVVLDLSKKLPFCGVRGIQRFTPLHPLQRTVRERVEHCPPSRCSDTIEPLTPLSLLRSTLQVTPKDIARPTKTELTWGPVTRPRLPRSGMPSIDRCPSQADSTVTALPP